MTHGRAVLLTPEAAELLNKRGSAIFCLPVPGGRPQATFAGVLVDGDELVIYTALGAQRVKEYRTDQPVYVLAVDPDDTRCYVEVRGIASLSECAAEKVGTLLRPQAAKNGLPRRSGQLPAGIRVVQVRIKPTEINHVASSSRGMRPQARPGDDCQ